MTKQKG